MENLSLVPENWTLAKFTDICSFEKNAIKRGPFGSSIKKNMFVPSGYKVYEQKNAIYNDFSLGDYYITQEKYQELIDFSIKPGDFIVSCAGTIGKISLVPEVAEPGIINQALLKISLNSNVVDHDYFLTLFRSQFFQASISKNAQGSAMKNMASVKVLKNSEVLLPPLNEQRRIMAKIEALTERSRKAREAIADIPALLDQFRQSVLAAAFRGDLTADWRKQNPDVEPASVLLERIRTERCDRWENAELERMTAKGKAPKNDKWRAKYKEPGVLDKSKFPAIPENWCWIDIDTLLRHPDHLSYGILKPGEYDLVECQWSE